MKKFFQNIKFKNINKKYLISICSVSVLCLFVLLIPIFSAFFGSGSSNPISDAVSNFTSSITGKENNKDENNKDESNNNNNNDNSNLDNNNENNNSGEEGNNDGENIDPNDQMMNSNNSNSNEQNNGDSQNNGNEQNNNNGQDNSQQTGGTPTPPAPTPTPTPVKNEVRGVWISYIDLAKILRGKSSSQFSSNLDTVYQNVKNLGANTVYVHVHPFGDSLYPSKFFPWSAYASGTQGVDPGFDPLAIMVSKAKQYGLKFHAWFNPYRVSNTGGSGLSWNNPAVLYPNIVLKVGDKWTLNPADQFAINLVVESIKEVVANYAVDGVQFDDYFYPSTDMSIDANWYQNYRNSGGSLSQADWRRENVDRLVSSTYNAIKSIKGSVLFGVSPQGNNQNNFSTQFANVSKWGQSTGYVDYIAPQIYWGFEHATAAFPNKIAEWTGIVSSNSVQLIIGLGPYKAGKQESSYAGAGINEWVTHSDIVARQILEIRKNSKISGFILFSYDSIFNPANQNAVNERENIRNVLK